MVIKVCTNRSRPFNHRMVPFEASLSLRDATCFSSPPTSYGPSDLFRGGRLFAAVYGSMHGLLIEDKRVALVRNNQKTIRSDLYDGLRDALRHDPNVQLGKGESASSYPHPILAAPVTCTSSSDSMAITRHCGKPDIFLTMTQIPAGQRSMTICSHMKMMMTVPISPGNVRHLLIDLTLLHVSLASEDQGLLKD